MANTLICNECHSKPVRCKGLCANCYQRTVAKRMKQQRGISVTKLQKGWTRHGGINRSYQMTGDEKEWVCQACAQPQPPQLVAYLFPFMESDVLRICSPCQNLVTLHNITEFKPLMKLVRF